MLITGSKRKNYGRDFALGPFLGLEPIMRVTSGLSTSLWTRNFYVQWKRFAECCTLFYTNEVGHIIFRSTVVCKWWWTSLFCGKTLTAGPPHTQIDIFSFFCFDNRSPTFSIIHTIISVCNFCLKLSHTTCLQLELYGINQAFARRFIVFNIIDKSRVV
jgi:hypothetical protein